MEYLDFDIEIGEGSGRSYPVAVVGSPGGDAHGAMHFPFAEQELPGRLRDLQDAMLRSSSGRRRTVVGEELVVQEFGSALFDALFTDELRSVLDLSLNEVARQSKGLRLKLHCKPARLASLPWEFLFDRRGAGYLCLSVRTPLVRYLAVSRPVEVLKVAPPLRILGMIAAPSNLAGLDVDRERERIDKATKALRDGGVLELQWLDGQTWSDLQEALYRNAWHMFHFIGHGGFDPDTGEGLVAFAGDDGRSRDLGATDLGMLLGDHPTMRLVILNSCEGARSDPKDLFSSTAAVLVRKGVPAVVAMQYEISDRAAVELARSFYRAIAAGMPVDSSLAEARKAVRLALANTLEWGTPVLFMRSHQGALFELTSAPPRLPGEEDLPSASGAPAEVLPALGDAPLSPDTDATLDLLWARTLGAYYAQRWDEAVDLLEAVARIRPDSDDVAAKLAIARAERDLSQRYEEARAAEDASEWEAAANTYERVAATRADYNDVTARLDRCRRQQHLARLDNEMRAVAAAEEWEAVVAIGAQLAELDPDRADLDELVETARRNLDAKDEDRRLAELYQRARAAEEDGQPETAIAFYREMEGLRPGHQDVVERQLSLRFEEARAAEDAGEWEAAASAYELVAATRADYRDVAARLGHCRRQRSIARLHDELRAVAGAEEWEAVLAVGSQLAELDPDSADADELVEMARRRLDAEDRRLAELYQRARASEDYGLLAAAFASYCEIENLRPSYRDVADRIRRLDGDGLRTGLFGREMKATSADETTKTTKAEDAPPGWSTSVTRRTSGASVNDVIATTQKVSSLAFSPDGRRLAAGLRSWARIWEVEPSTVGPYREAAQIRVAMTLWTDAYDWRVAIAFSPDGLHLATVLSHSGKPAQIWDVSSGVPVRDVGTSGATDAVAYSPDGCRLATGSTDKTARVWDSSSGAQVLGVAHAGWLTGVNGVAFSPDGRSLATSSTDKTARIWNASSGAQLLVVRHGSGVNAVAFSPDGRRLATASIDKTARVWDASSGAQLLVVRHDYGVSAVAFSPDGRRLATATNDAARVWDASSGSEVLEIGHAEGVNAVAFSPDGRRLATGGDDKTIRLSVLDTP